MSEPIPLRDQIACIALEIELREHIVAEGRMTMAEVAPSLHRMRAVLATLQECEAGAADEPA